MALNIIFSAVCSLPIKNRKLVCAPQIVHCKSVIQKGCCDIPDAMIGWIGRFPRHLGSLLGAIEQPFSMGFVCRVGCFDAQIREIILYKLGVDLLTSLEKHNLLITWNNIQNNLHSSSFPLLHL